MRTPERVSPYRPAEIPPEREILPSEVPRLRAKSSDPFANSLEDLIPEKRKDKERSRPRKQTKRSIVPNIPAPKSDRDSRHKKRQPLLKGTDIVRTEHRRENIGNSLASHSVHSNMDRSRSRKRRRSHSNSRAISGSSSHDYRPGPGFRRSLGVWPNSLSLISI